MISLSITESDRVPTATVISKVKQWNVAPGVVPSSLVYFRIRGGQGYIIGVPADTASKLLKEKDATKLRKMMASMIIPEMQAARSGMPSPGKMILLMQSGDSISQVTQSSPGMGKKAGISAFLAPTLASAAAGAIGTAASNYAAGRDLREGTRRAALVGAGTGALLHGVGRLTSPAAPAAPVAPAPVPAAPVADAARAGKMASARRLSVFAKFASELSYRARKNLGTGDFALPGRRYPIHDRPHARNALARVAQHGTSSEQSQVQKAVHARFPDIGEEKRAAGTRPEWLAGKSLRHWARQRRVPNDAIANELANLADDPKSWVNDPKENYLWSSRNLGRTASPTWEAAHAAHWGAEKKAGATLQKVAYGDKEHRGLAGVAARGAGADGEARQLIQQGALATDKGIRHPFLPHTDPLHAFGGSQTRGQIGRNVAGRHQAAVHDIAQSIAGRAGKQGLVGRLKSGARGVRGLMNLGDVQHTVADISAHYDKPRAMGATSPLRGILPKTGYGGILTGAHEHTNVEKLVAGAPGAMSEIDKLNPSSSHFDRQAVARSRALGSTARKQVVKKLVSEHGMSPEEAARHAQDFFTSRSFSPASQRLGQVSRDLKYTKSEIARAAQVPGNLLARAKGAVTHPSSALARLAEKAHEVAPSARGTTASFLRGLRTRIAE